MEAVQVVVLLGGQSLQIGTLQFEECSLFFVWFPFLR